MGMREVLTAIKKQLPPFNNFLIRGFRKQEFENLPAFIGQCYEGCARVISPELKLTGYRIVPPVERLNTETRMLSALNSVNISYDEAILVSYEFQYYDTIFEHKIYIPYIFEDGSINIRGTRYECLLNMTEKLFSVKSDGSGFTTKLIRFPISFWRNTFHSILDVGDSKKQFIGNVICCRLHDKHPPKSVKRIRPTALLYMLCTYSLPQVLGIFGLPADAASYDQTDKYDPNYYYFRVQKLILAKMPTLLKVNKQLMDSNRTLYNIAITMAYTLESSQLTSFEDMTTNPEMIYKIILGKIIHGSNLKRTKVLNYMVKHLKSVDDFLDEYTKSMMKANGIIVNNIYEFLVYVVNNIDGIISNNAPNNMFNKRLDTINSAVIEGMFRYLYNQVYNYEVKDDHKYMVNEVVTKALKVQQRQVLKTLNLADNVRFSTAVQSDNWLVTIGSKVVKRLSVTNLGGGKKASGGKIQSEVNKFHPSMLLLESMYGVGSAVGVSVLLNPYSQIDSLGAFVKTDLAEKIDAELGSILRGNLA